ncbi:hypothetical protein GCM10010324_03000 [Streptomyces hiroshimensis]|uniref:PPM-type phosphatase domain-containing protein n=1 Tax=Streptomyces hiroshimensis TaxID=66424 RepID=A0ABQ2Y5G1_9ACTN|nr:hypothetical protein GCM10010324_03000 [Streptomyces hiroshimensis]
MDNKGMSQQGDPRTGQEDAWWGELYDKNEPDIGSAAGDDSSLDERFTSASAVVRAESGGERPKRAQRTVRAPRAEPPDPPRPPDPVAVPPSGLPSLPKGYGAPRSRGVPGRSEFTPPPPGAEPPPELPPPSRAERLDDGPAPGRTARVPLPRIPKPPDLHSAGLLPELLEKPQKWRKSDPRRQAEVPRQPVGPDGPVEPERAPRPERPERPERQDPRSRPEPPRLPREDQPPGSMGASGPARPPRREPDGTAAGSPARSQRPARPVAGERPGRPARSDRCEGADLFFGGTDRRSRSGDTDRADRPDRSAPPRRAERVDRSDYADASDQADQADRAACTERAGRSDAPGSAQAERSGDGEVSGRSNRPARVSRSEGAEHFDDLDVPEPADDIDGGNAPGRPGRSTQASRMERARASDDARRSDDPDGEEVDRSGDGEVSGRVNRPAQTSRSEPVGRSGEPDVPEPVDRSGTGDAPGRPSRSAQASRSGHAEQAGDPDSPQPDRAAAGDAPGRPGLSGGGDRAGRRDPSGRAGLAERTDRPDDPDRPAQPPAPRRSGRLERPTRPVRVERPLRPRPPRVEPPAPQPRHRPEPPELPEPYGRPEFSGIPAQQRPEPAGSLPDVRADRGLPELPEPVPSPARITARDARPAVPEPGGEPAEPVEPAQPVEPAGPAARAAASLEPASRPPVVSRDSTPPRRHPLAAPPQPSRGPARPTDYVGERPPTYDAEPTAWPAADPQDLDGLVPDTVLDGAQYGAVTLRALSLRGDSARYRGEPRRDSLLTARFGDGDSALLLVAMASGTRGSNVAPRAARDACMWLAGAVGRSHARLADDIRGGRRGELKSGLHRLTDRSYGRLRARAAELDLRPDEYTATVRCLLLTADPQCRTRVFFGVGAGGLFRLREGVWQDLEPDPPAERTGEPVIGYGSAPADSMTVDLGIPTPGLAPPVEPVEVEAPGEPFRFRASVARPGDTLMLCTAGLADPMRGEPELGGRLAERWAGERPPGLAAFLADTQLRVKGYADDRTACAVWEA